MRDVALDPLTRMDKGVCPEHVHARVAIRVAAVLLSATAVGAPTQGYGGNVLFAEGSRSAVAAPETSPSGRLPIIPGAHGFGIDTPAGSGRHLAVPKTTVYKVTNLNPRGPGSLRQALEAEGPRVVVFEVSGNIEMVGSVTIKHPYITVAGQTAPSPGITLKRCELDVRASDVLIQHIRVRVGDLLDPSQPERDEKSGWTQWGERDCMKVGGDRVIIDHCSFSWATDENVQSRGSQLNFRQNIFSEGLQSEKHHKGGHSKGLLLLNQGRLGTRKEGQDIAVIGNLFAHNKDRNPNAEAGVKAAVVNNLVYDANVGIKAADDAKHGAILLSAAGNVTKRTRCGIVARAIDPGTRLYFAPNNTFNGKTFDSVAEVWKVVHMPFQPGVPEANRPHESPVTVPGLTVKPAAEVEAWVLANAGARPADRDPVDERIVSSVQKQTGAIIASQEDVGGWPDLAQNHRVLVLPKNPNGDDNANGYTNLEEWLHAFAAKVEQRTK